MLRSAPAGLGFIKPELPTLVPEPATGGGWIDDGYRTLMTIDRGRVRAFTRNGNDWTRAHKRVIAFAADPTPTRSVRVSVAAREGRSLAPVLIGVFGQ
jgi:ATP-dependent DNA ligase